MYLLLLKLSIKSGFTNSKIIKLKTHLECKDNNQYNLKLASELIQLHLKLSL